MIVDDSTKLIPKVAPVSSDVAEKKETLRELIFLHQQLAELNAYLAAVLLKLSFETGLDWRDQFHKLQSESVLYQYFLAGRIQQLIANAF